VSARKSVYAITDEACDGGVSPNAYVPRITAEVRMHFPPNTVSETQVRAVLEASYNKTIIQMHEFFEERRKREDRRDDDVPGVRVDDGPQRAEPVTGEGGAGADEPAVSDPSLHTDAEFFARYDFCRYPCAECDALDRAEIESGVPLHRRMSEGYSKVLRALKEEGYTQ
jgi:hypothetical protein